MTEEEKTLGQKLDTMLELLNNAGKDMHTYLSYHDSICEQVKPMGLTLEYDSSSHRYALLSVSEL